MVIFCFSILMFDLSSLATVCRLVMSNQHTSPILPMPAAMAGLPSGFDIARGVLAEVGRKMEAGGEFCDTVLDVNAVSRCLTS